MTNIEIAWLAGIIEGEGCLSSRRTPTVTVVMTDFDVVEKIANLFGKHVHSAPGAKAHHKEIYRASVYGDEAIKIMEAILPHMGDRRSSKINEIFELRKLKKVFVRADQARASKVKNSDVVSIRKLAKEGMLGKKKDAAKKYGITRSTLHRILNNKTYLYAVEPIDVAAIALEQMWPVTA